MFPLRTEVMEQVVGSWASLKIPKTCRDHDHGTARILGHIPHHHGARGATNTRKMEAKSRNEEIQRQVTSCPDLEREYFTIHDLLCEIV